LVELLLEVARKHADVLALLDSGGCPQHQSAEESPATANPYRSEVA
jgi:hypothetical protein